MAVHSILLPWLRCGEVPVPGTQPFPCSFTCLEPWRPLGAERACEARQVLGEGRMDLQMGVSQ